MRFEEAGLLVVMSRMDARLVGEVVIEVLGGLLVVTQRPAAGD